MSEKKRFATTNREEVPFDVDGQDYVLVTPTALATRRYREESLSGAEMEFVGKDEDPDGQRRIIKKMKGIAAVQARLVADCTYKVLKDGGREGPLTPEFVEDKFPADCIEWAFAELKRIGPWLTERDDGKDIAALRARIKADQDRLARLEAADPKA